MFKKHEMVKLKEPKIHFGTKELIEIEVENVFPKEVSYGTLLVDPLNAI